MMDIETIAFFVFAILFVIVILVFLIQKVKRNKTLAISIPPTRHLDSEDLKAIQYLEIDSNLTVDIILNPKILKKKIYNKVWKYDNITFYVTSVYKYKRLIYNFHLTINDITIEVIIPDIFLPYLNENEPYINKTIEILYRMDHYVLYDIKGVIGYKSLYEKFQLNSKTDNEFIAKRPATKEEQAAFSTSKWSSMWAIFVPILFPFFILAIMDEGLGISIVFLPFFLLIIIPLRKAYKKRKKYIESRIVYTLKGTIWLDETRYIYRIDDKALKLHQKWKKAFKKTKLPIENAEIEVLMHTYDALDLKAKLSFQPIAIKSSGLNINEDTLPSTRDWVIPLLYLIATGFVVYLAPQYSNVIVDITSIQAQTEDLIFKLVMTLIWWLSIPVTLYLSYLVVVRIKNNYFIPKQY